MVPEQNLGIKGHSRPMLLRCCPAGDMAHTPGLARTTVEALKMTESTLPDVLTRAPPQKTRAVTARQSLIAVHMRSVEAQGRGKTVGGQPSASPKYHPRPQITEKALTFMDNWKMDRPIPWARAETIPRVVLMRAAFSQGGGGGG